MTQGAKTIIYPVKDTVRAKKLFGALLGVEHMLTNRITSAFALATKN